MRVLMLSKACIVVLLMTIIYLLVSSLVAAQALEFQIDVTYYIDFISWSPDGQLLAVSGSDGLWIYSSNLEEVAQLQQTETDFAYSTSWKPDSTQLASVGNGQIFIWKRNPDNTFSVETTLYLEDYLQVLVSWSPDGTRLASQDYPDVEDLRWRLSRIHIWDTASWTIERTLPEEYTYGEHFPLALRWNGDGTLIAGTGFDRNEGEIAFVSDVVTGERIRVLPQVAPVAALDWGNDGLLAIGDWGFAIYDTNAGQYLYTILDAREVRQLSWSPDGTKLLLVDDGVAEIREYAVNQILATLPDAYKLAWSPGGDKIAAAGINQSTNSRALQIWDVTALPDLSGTPTLTPYAIILPTYTPTP